MPQNGLNPSIPLVLASRSPRRRQWLRRVVPRFRVVESGVPEPPPRAGVDVGRYVQRLARRKAWSVARTLREGLVLGADTVVFRRGTIYGKPADPSDARRILSELNGKWHEVYTGLALVSRPGGRVWTGVYRTRVRLKRLSPQDLHRLSFRHLDKAGAYAAQAKGNPFVDRIRGDFDNVIGLPLRGVRELLARAGGATRGATVWPVTAGRERPGKGIGSRVCSTAP